MLGYDDTRWWALAGEMRAFGTAALSMPLRWLPGAGGLQPGAPSETPVILAHGLCGDPTNLLVLERRLAAVGVRNVAHFAYRPSLDYQRLAAEMRELVDDVRAATGARQVDVVGHSLGGLVGRYLTEDRQHAVRRLVTLGSPAWGRFFRRELAIFGDADVIVPTPDASRAAPGRIRIVRGCGHLGLLYHPAVLDEVVAYLSEPANEDRVQRGRVVSLAARRRAA